MKKSDLVAGRDYFDTWEQLFDLPPKKRKKTKKRGKK